MSIITPCKGCTDRHEACHSTCEKYKDWKQEFEVLKANVTKGRSFQNEIYAVQKAGIKRMKTLRKSN